MAKINSHRIGWKALPFALVLTAGIWGTDAASADPFGTDVGDVTFQLSDWPQAPTVPFGGGPFQLSLTTITPNPVGGVTIPNSVQAFCVETLQHISVGTTYTMDLLLQGPSKIGGLLQDGLKWLNVVGGGVQFTSAGTTALASFISQGWSASEVGAAIQQQIWSLQLGQALPSTIGDQTSAQTSAFLTSLSSTAASVGYYRLHDKNAACTDNVSNSACVQDQIFAVPGPLAGAGLPGLIAACVGLLALARRRRSWVRSGQAMLS
jgi:hypothetical protein